MNADSKSKRHVKRQNDIIQVNLKNKTTPTIDRYYHRNNEITLEMIDVVAGQLGYHPFNIVDIVYGGCKRVDGSDRNPLVAVLYPLNHNEEVGGRYSGDEGPKPFPTTLWITCPDLHTRISKLEDLGYINKFQQKLLNDSNSAQWLEEMRNAHFQYAAFRWSLLSPEHKELVSSSGWTSALKDVGIAGIRNFDRVKCLHCHYAHHLSRPQDGNIIGLWIGELLELNIDEIEKKVVHSKNLTEIEVVTDKLNDSGLDTSGNISAADTPVFSRGVSSLSGGDSTIPGDDAPESVEKHKNGQITADGSDYERSSTEGESVDDIAVLRNEHENLSKEQLDIAAKLARKEKFESSGMFRFIYDGPEGSGDLEAGSIRGVNKTEVKSTRCQLCTSCNEGTEMKNEKGKSSCVIS